jgi:hypothetical protein
MNQRRMNILLEQQTETARKVLAAVPIQEAWESSKVFGELKREGIGISFKVVEGCLSSLAEDGLIKEHPKGRFRRLLLDDRAVVGTPGPAPGDPVEIGVDLARDGADAMAFMMVSAKRKPDLLDRLGGISTKLRELADEIDAAAIEASEEVKRAGEDGGKLRQLRELFKGIVG